MYRDTTGMFIRNQINGVFTDWQPINEKLIAYLILANSTINTIATEHTYQSLKFSSINGSNFAKNFITFDSDSIDENNNYTSFKINKTGMFNIRVNLQWYSNIAEGKYIKITKNGSDINNSIIKTKLGTGDYTTYLECLINNTNVSDVYDIKIYGSQNDSISRGSIIVECV